MENWEILYDSGRIQNLYINWNPTIYNFRKTVHFAVPVKFQNLKNEFYNPKFQAQRYGQILFTVNPHDE